MHFDRAGSPALGGRPVVEGIVPPRIEVISRVVSGEFGCHADAELDHGVVVAQVETLIGHWPGRVVHTDHVDGRVGEVTSRAWRGDVENLRQRVADGRDEVIFVALDILDVACIESNSKSLVRFDDGVHHGRNVEGQVQVTIPAHLLRQEGWRGRRARWTLCTHGINFSQCHAIQESTLGQVNLSSNQ